MAQITMRDLSQTIDVAQVEVQARNQWERERRKRMTLAEYIINGLPLGLVVMVLVFWLLSAPHTVSVLDIITPGFGWVAPVGFEISILVLSALIEAGWRSRMTYGLLGLLILMAVMVNTAGSFMVVVASATEISGMTFAQIMGQWPVLPAVNQVALLLVLPIGIAVPFIGKLAGDGVVKIALGRVELASANADDLWEMARDKQVKSALMNAALKVGAGTRTAGKWAERIVQETTDTILPEPVPAISQVGNDWEMGNARIYGFADLNRSEPQKTVENGFPTGKWEMAGKSVPTTGKPAMDACIQHLVDNPEDMRLSGRTLEERYGTSYRTWNDARKHLTRLQG